MDTRSLGGVYVFIRDMGELKPFDSSVKGLREYSPEL